MCVCVWYGPDERGLHSDSYQSRAVVTREILLTDLYQYPKCFLEQERREKRETERILCTVILKHWPGLTSAVMCMSRVAATGAMAYESI